MPRFSRTSLHAPAVLVCIALMMLAFVPAPTAGATEPASFTSNLPIAQLDGVIVNPDGRYSLSPDALTPPLLLGNYQRHGILLSNPVSLPRPIQRVQLSYQASVPNGSALQIDVRGSLDGARWLPWTTDLADAAVIGFAQPIRWVQYRVTLLGSFESSPQLSPPLLTPSNAPATTEAAAVDPAGIAPTYRIRATRQGMIGGRTANGYIIPPKARFVSLPAWSVLSSKGGNEYQVRITYRGRSTVVPVYDVGPYSGRDDYWDIVRDGYPELERGWPMDHAAYYEGYNNKQADKGYVRFPTAMDVGDGAWIDDLGIVGDQAEVEVTYLWLGQDPLAGPPSRDPAKSTHQLSELGGDFWQNNGPFGVSPVGCGQGRHAYRTLSVSDTAKSVSIARWQPNLPASGLYDVYVHVPICPAKQAPTSKARYVIQHAESLLEIGVDQSTQTGWVLLGRYPFKAGTEGFIQLSDLAGDAGRTIWFDDARFVRVP